jgi:hypothetical protein
VALSASKQGHGSVLVAAQEPHPLNAVQCLGFAGVGGAVEAYHLMVANPSLRKPFLHPLKPRLGLGARGPNHSEPGGSTPAEVNKTLDDGFVVEGFCPAY